jgi:hypothetical protein
VYLSGASGEVLRRTDGPAAGDLLGASLVCGDEGVWAGAPLADPAGIRDAGRVSLFGLDGEERAHVDGQRSGDQLGRRLAEVPDLDGDGRPELLFGAPGGSGRREGGGRVLLAFSRGEAMRELRSDGAGDGFGSAASAGGDLDGDGRPDILVGAPLADPRGVLDAGSVYVYSAGGELLRRIDGREAGAHFGAAVTGGHDLDGDGRADFAIGAPGTSVGDRRQAGRVYVYTSTGKATTSLDGDSADGLFGQSVQLTGDLNGDGRSELVVGAPGDVRQDVTGTSTFFFSEVPGGDPR